MSANSLFHHRPPTHPLGLECPFFWSSYLGSSSHSTKRWRRESLIPRIEILSVCGNYCWSNQLTNNRAAMGGQGWLTRTRKENTEIKAQTVGQETHVQRHYPENSLCALTPFWIGTVVCLCLHHSFTYRYHIQRGFYTWKASNASDLLFLQLA